MAFIDWLRKQHEESARNQALFAGRPRVAASQAWGGYQDRPGGQRLMVRQPKVDNTLTVKDDGTRTHVKKWTDAASGLEPRDILRASALPPEPVMSPGRPIPPPRRQRNPFDMPIASLPPSSQRHVPRMRGDIGSTESIGVADPDPRYRGMKPSLANVGTPNILQRFMQGRQSIADRIERNRIERLMQYRTRNPYFPTGGRY
jgi:hypothetical protein